MSASSFTMNKTSNVISSSVFKDLKKLLKKNIKNTLNAVESELDQFDQYKVEYDYMSQSPMVQELRRENEKLKKRMKNI